MIFFKSLFKPKHTCNYDIIKVVFPRGVRNVNATMSGGLTDTCRYADMSTDHYLLPYTIIHSYYEVKNGNVSIYGKYCRECKSVKPINGVEVQLHKEDIAILREEGLLN